MDESRYSSSEGGEPPQGTSPATEETQEDNLLQMETNEDFSKKRCRSPVDETHSTAITKKTKTCEKDSHRASDADRQIVPSCSVLASQKTMQSTSQSLSDVEPPALPSFSKSRTQLQLTLAPHSPQNVSTLTKTPLDAHPGVIKSLKLKNFMCHSKFSHDFHPNLNFITGQNGSGKSAILSGILVALGGKASSTSRTNSLKDLVQKGKTIGRVSVTLLNKNGLRGYGEEITIERWISGKGGAGYRIQDSAGEPVWRLLNKPELDKLLAGFNIQIDNPVAILNQEVARTFLRTMDPKTKFRLFYEGSLLSKMEAVLLETAVELEDTKLLLDNRRQELTFLQRQMLEDKQKLSKIEKLDELFEKRSQLQGEYLWALVIEQEKQVEVAKELEKAAIGEVELVQYDIDSLNEKLADVNEEAILRKEAATKEELTEKEKILDKLRVEFKDAHIKVVSLKAKLKSLTNTSESQHNQIKNLEGSFQAAKAADATKTSGEAEEDKATLEKLQVQKKQYESALTSLKEEQDNLHQEECQERENVQRIEKEGRKLRREIEIREKEITALNDNRASKYAAFGTRMEMLMVKIQVNLDRFQRPPIGPLGACFRVKDPKYAAVIERILFPHLHSFVVGDARDVALIKKLIDSVYPDSQGFYEGGAGKKPDIHCMQFSEEAYDVSENHVCLPVAPSILSLIEGENNDHLVINALIDIADIERQIIFGNCKSALGLLKNKDKVPKMMKHAFSLDWYRIIPDPRLGYRLVQFRKCSILQSGGSKELQIQTLQTEIKQVQADVEVQGTIKSGMQEKAQSLRRRYEEKEKQVREARRKLGQVNNEMRRQMDNMKEKERRCDFASYEEELKDLREDYQTGIAELNAVKAELEPMRLAADELEAQNLSLKREISELAAEKDRLEDSRQELSVRRREIRTSVSRLQESLKSAEANKSFLSGQLATKERELHEKLEVALKDYPLRIDTERTAADVQNDIDQHELLIAETEVRRGSLDLLNASLHEKRQMYIQIRDKCLPLKQMYKVVRQIHSAQQTRFEKIKAHMGRTLTYMFSVMAKRRGYEGRLMVDFEAKELYYFVCPDGDATAKTVKLLDAQLASPGSSEQHGKTLKKALVEYALGLSGGERSFSTICFIMALWQTMECPFYMLDEFDVFMDAFNRKASQEALLGHAQQFAQNQFVMFSPLDLGGLPRAEDACVLRLFPPVRGEGGAGGTSGSGSNPDEDQLDDPQPGPSASN